MSRVFGEDGKAVPVTLLRLNEAEITRIKDQKSKDGYNACVVSYKRSNNGEKKVIEFKVDDISQYKVGDKLEAELFVVGDTVTVVSNTKGKGFAGTIKRHGFHRGPVTHGSHNIRKPGSIGGGYPQRVVPGKKMAGRMGDNSSTIKNLKVVDIIEKDNILLISGSIGGPKNSTVKVYTSK